MFFQCSFFLAKSSLIFPTHDFTVNSFIDSAIRVAARWYQSHLGGSIQVLLITNDRENKRKAIEEGLSAETGTHVLPEEINI